MAELYNILKSENTYYDRKNYSSLEEYTTALQLSTTVYVGNLSFYTSQDSIRQLFSFAGKVTEIIMGINDQGHPCGFCFVVYQTHDQARNAVQFISKTKLNDRIIRVDWDPGYKKGREKGRGTGGQQRREDFRSKEDAERPRKKPAYYQNRERGDRNERYERGDRADRGDRGDRGDRYDRSERPERERTRQRDYGHRDRDHHRREREQDKPRAGKETQRQQNEEY